MPKKNKTKISESQITEILAEILHTLDSGNMEKAIAFFHDMPEEERRRYAKPIFEFCRTKQDIFNHKHWDKIARGVWHALLATATPNEIEKSRVLFRNFRFSSRCTPMVRSSQCSGTADRNGWNRLS